MTYEYNAKLEWLLEKKSNGQLKLVPVSFEKVFMQSRLTPQGATEKIWTLMLTRVTTEHAGKYVCKLSVNESAEFLDLNVTVRGKLLFKNRTK